MRWLMLLLTSVSLGAAGLSPISTATAALDDAKPEQEESETVRERSTQQPAISITTAIEEGKTVVLATVTLEDKPAEGVQVAFFVERTFGLLPLGTEETLDDGTVAVPFPQGLPGGPTGELQVVAVIKAPPEYAGVRGRATLGGGVVIEPKLEPFPRAVWAPKSPLPLLLIIATLVGGVWCAYAYVFIQLLKIRKGS